MKYLIFILGFSLPFSILSCASVRPEHKLEPTFCGSIMTDDGEIRRYMLPAVYYVDNSVPESIAILIENAVKNINKQSGMELLALVPKAGGWAEPIVWVGSDWPFQPNQIAVTQVWSINNILTSAPINLRASELVTMDEELIQITIEHEFGHALGLDHDKTNREDLMWPSAGNNSPDYSQSVKILQCLYK